MKTILITGGANGLGKGIAQYYLKKGFQVIAVGSSKENGDIFCNEAKQLKSGDRAFYIQADLSLIKENQRVIESVKERFPSLDAIIFCATRHSKEYIETVEGFEFTFALDYMSRFLLSYGLKESLEKSDNPIIVNICGTGMKGEVNWNDLQHKDSFDTQKVMMHGSRLNDLSAVAFVQNDATRKIKYILYNPWAVQTPGMMGYFNNPLMRSVYKIIGKPVEKAVVPIVELLNNPPKNELSAFREQKKLNMNLPAYSPQNAKKLYNITSQLIKNQ